jgi:hypothetical protein
MTHDNLITAEFHCHTVYTHDSSNRLPQLLETARRRCLGKLAVTDHNTIRGALKARELDPELVVVGEEILTTQGELLGYFLNEEVPPHLSPAETIACLREQGAFIAVPHPFDRMRHGWREADLEAVLPDVDALEVFNARCLRGGINARARQFAEERGIPMMAGSDAHALVELGLATVHLPDFSDAEGLRAALCSAQITGKLLSPLDHFRASCAIGLGRAARVFTGTQEFPGT